MHGCRIYKYQNRETLLDETTQRAKYRQQLELVNETDTGSPKSELTQQTRTQNLSSTLRKEHSNLRAQEDYRGWKISRTQGQWA